MSSHQPSNQPGNQPGLPSRTASSAEFTAIVLAGGTAARMGGADKGGLELRGRTLLEHALDAVVEAAEVVVVGDPVPTESPARFVREDPAYGGPAAALLTGLGALLRSTPTVVVLAVDMPRVTAHTVQRLRRASHGHDGSVLVDATGRRQLAMALDGVVLAATAPSNGAWQGLSLFDLLASLELAEVAATGDEGRDVDTWNDLRDLRGPPG